MRRKILIPTDEANRRTEIARINSEIARIEEETRNLREQREAETRLQQARSWRDTEERRLNRTRPSDYHYGSSSDTEPKNEWSLSFKEASTEKATVKLQKVDTAKFVFAWENSSSAEEAMSKFDPGASTAEGQRLADFVRTVEGVPLKQLPDEAPKIKEGRASNLTLPKE